MIAEDLVCSFEQGNRLRSLMGFDLKNTSKSYFSWCELLDGSINLVESSNQALHAKLKNACYAYTSQELGEIIESLLDPLEEEEIAWYSHKKYPLLCNAYWTCFYRQGNSILLTYNFDAQTEAKSRAQFLIYLLENKE